MSWSVTTNLVSKSNAKAAIALLQLDGGQIHSAWAVDQLETAKNAAREILKGMPGPYVIIALSGHANGTGWNKKDGYSSDTINVSVSQVCQEDLKHYTTLNELETDDKK
jgi:hypothetical protein